MPILTHWETEPDTPCALVHLHFEGTWTADDLFQTLIGINDIAQEDALNVTAVYHLVGQVRIPSGLMDMTRRIITHGIAGICAFYIITESRLWRSLGNLILRLYSHRIPWETHFISSVADAPSIKERCEVSASS